MTTEEILAPNYAKLDVALRSIGYSFEVAVADIVDNSLDAKATHVNVRLMLTAQGHLDLAILDDGAGMTPETLKEAMRFGADVSRDIERLGKFGLGLKLASLSQAKEVHVVTMVNGRLSGRAWLEQGIAKGFASTIYDERECTQLVANAFPGHRLGPTGTMVHWSRLYRVGHHHGKNEEHAQKLLRRLEHHLSMAFHRFLGGQARQVEIAVDILDTSSGKPGIPKLLDPLDPFDYSSSGTAGFPLKLIVDGAFKSRIAITAHIWPPHSTSPAYKLPGGANARQGFYFYRNNRLIQGGGWNGIREAEPHSSLARLEVDIAPSFDVEVSLDVKKVEIQLPPDLVTSILRARSSTGVDFKRYLSLANEAYRTRSVKASDLPLIPSAGLPAPLSAFLHDELRLQATAKHRDLSIVWQDLEATSFFEIDRDDGLLILNRSYRRLLLHGLPGSSADIPVVKCLLFLVLQEALTSERMGSKMRDRLEQINRILLAAVKHERSSE